MINGARQLGQLRSIARAPAVVPPPVVAPPSAVIPVILRATAAEAKGAQMRIGGVRVVDRAIRQLARLRDARVIVLSDDSIRLPRRMPRNIEQRDVDGDVETALAALRAELGPDTTTVGANTVWLQAGRLDEGIRVIDPASCRAAADSVFADLRRDSVGIFDRLINRRISTALTRRLFAKLPVRPAFLTLLAGCLGLYGALLVASGTSTDVVMGFAVLEGYVILAGCSTVLARLRVRQSRLTGWLDTLIGDAVSIALILAVGRALWGGDGTFLEMQLAAAGAAMTLFYAIVTYRELLRQGAADVSKLRWWFCYGQPLLAVRGAGSRSIRAVTMLGRRDMVIGVSLVLAALDQLPMVLLVLLIVAISRAGAALVQLFTPGWRIRPPA
jgi:hypothetical protein